MPYSSDPAYTTIASEKDRALALAMRDEVLRGDTTRADCSDRLELIKMSNAQVTVADFNAAKSKMTTKARSQFE